MIVRYVKPFSHLKSLIKTELALHYKGAPRHSPELLTFDFNNTKNIFRLYFVSHWMITLSRPSIWHKKYVVEPSSGHTKINPCTLHKLCFMNRHDGSEKIPRSIKWSHTKKNLNKLRHQEPWYIPKFGTLYCHMANNLITYQKILNLIYCHMHSFWKGHWYTIRPYLTASKLNQLFPSNYYM